MSASRLSSLAVGLMVMGAEASYSVHPQQPAPYHNVSSASAAEQHTTTLSTAASNVYTTEKTSAYSVIPVSSQSTLATTSDCTNTTISTVIKTSIQTSIKHTTSHANFTVPHYTVIPPTTKKPSVPVTMTTVPVTITETSTCTTTTPPPIITHNSCDQTCSMSAGTVNLFFWPTDNDFIYPSTHVDTDLGYTFTRPSVYMLIPTIYGTNTIDGATVAPSATSAIWAFDLSEVSTIEGGTATKQLSLSDLGTDCPQTAAASEIATMTNSRCDPILAAPDKIRAWASPCAACDRFGLFDPPYAVPTITGGLVPTTIAQPPPPAPTTEAPKPAPTTEAPAPTTEAPAPKPTTEAPAPPAPQPTTEVPAPPAPQPTTEAPAPPPPSPSTATAAPTTAEETAQPTTDAGVPAPSVTSATSAGDSYPTTDAGAGQSATTSAGAGESASASATTPAASTSATDGVTSPTPVASAAAAQMKSGVAGMVAAGLLVLMA